MTACSVGLPEPVHPDAEHHHADRDSGHKLCGNARAADSHVGIGYYRCRRRNTGRGELKESANLHSSNLQTKQRAAR